MIDSFYGAFFRKIKEKKEFKRNYSKVISIIGLIVLIFLFFMFKRTAIYLVFIAVTAVIIYYTKLYHVPIDISPMFLLEVVITRYYGIQYTLIYVLVAYIIPKTFAGTNMKFDSYMFIAISMIANLLVYAFPTMPLIYLGLVTSVVQYIGGVIFSLTMRPLFLAIFDGIANVANNLLWFLIFSDFIVWLMR